MPLIPILNPVARRPMAWSEQQYVSAPGVALCVVAAAGGVALDIPLVVLVNNNSASSAEILAGALKDAKRARLIGEPTFGTATVLRTFNLNDGAQVRIGTTQWLTPNGQVVRGKGIQPDELISLSPDVRPLSPANAAQLDPQALLQSDDAQLVRALEVLNAIAAK